MKKINYLIIDRILLQTNLNENSSSPHDYFFFFFLFFLFFPIKKTFHFYFNHMTYLIVYDLF